MYIYLMKKLIFILFIINCGSVGAQDDSLGLIKINQQIDDYVVSRNVKGLDSLYGEDFVFSHGSGHESNCAGCGQAAGRQSACGESRY